MMRTRRTFLLTVVVVLLEVAGPGIGMAETPEDTARAIARTAEVLAGEGKIEAALGLFEKAYALDPAPALLYNIGRLHDRQGAFAKAREYYERYLDRETDPDRLAKGQQRLDAVLDRIPGRLVVETTPPGAAIEVDGNRVASVRTPSGLEIPRGRHEVIARLADHAPERQTVVVPAGEEVRVRFTMRQLPGELKLSCDVPGARVTVNGKEERLTPLDRPIVVAAGSATVKVTAAGYEPWRHDVEVRPGAVVTLGVALKPLQARPTDVAPTRPARSVVVASPPMSPRRIGAWTSIGTGIALVVAGAVTYGLGYRDYRSIDTLDWDRQWDQVESKWNSARTKQNASIGLWSVGGAALITGIVLYFLPESSKAAVAPTGPDGGPGVSALVRW